VHVLPVVDGKPLKIGRGHECNMKIHDTSISRVQASIELIDGCFVLQDRGSRFGTYIKITKPLLLEAGQQSSVQVGRTLLQLSMRTSSSPSQASPQQIDKISAELLGHDALDTDTSASPRGCARSIAVGLEYSSPSRESFLSCEDA
jgi:predicted component of type VI protein secretion system